MEFLLATAAGSGTGHQITEVMTRFILQLAVILIAARLGGSFFKRWLKLPPVLGELSAGMLIGPFALGGLSVLGLPPLFEAASGALPVSSELYALATLASIILLFLAGLETDLHTFIRYFGTAGIVGIGGIVFSFTLGAYCAVWFGAAHSFMDPAALFMGSISTATSVGITARILSEKRKTHTPEGACIMAAAVLDDVLGIIILAVVIGIAQLEGQGGVNWKAIGLTEGKAFGFWLACTAIALASAKQVGRILKLSRNPATITTLALGLALLVAGLSEKAGLAMIIGAYITGLSLSSTDLVHFLQEQLEGIYNLTVPVFFCVMGMLVDLPSMGSVLTLGLTYTVIGILAKVLGCAVPAFFTRFNLRGSLRIGFGMLPRGEVALIIAGLGISTGIIESQLFGVCIMMTMITTLIAPPALIEAFKGGSGLKADQTVEPDQELRTIRLEFPSPDIADFLMSRITKAFRNEEFFVHRVHPETTTYQIRKEDISITIIQEGPCIQVLCAEQHKTVAGMIVVEEMLALRDLLESSKEMQDLEELETGLMQGLFR